MWGEYSKGDDSFLGVDTQRWYFAVFGEERGRELYLEALDRRVESEMKFGESVVNWVASHPELTVNAVAAGAWILSNMQP